MCFFSLLRTGELREEREPRDAQVQRLQEGGRRHRQARHAHQNRRRRQETGESEEQTNPLLAGCVCVWGGGAERPALVCGNPGSVY